MVPLAPKLDEAEGPGTAEYLQGYALCMAKFSLGLLRCIYQVTSDLT
jgi:hypothetical protein